MYTYVTGFGKTHQLCTKIIIQSILFPEGIKLHACNLLHSYSYSRSIRHSQLNAQLAEFPTVLVTQYFINTTSTYIGVEGGGGGWWGAKKWQATAELCNFEAEMVHKEAPLHSNCPKCSLIHGLYHQPVVWLFPARWLPVQANQWHSMDTRALVDI